MGTACDRARKWPPEWWHHPLGRLALSAWVGMALLALGQSAWAKPAPDAAIRDGEKVEELSATGEIVAVTKQFLSIELARTSVSAQEMAFTLDEQVRVEGPKALAQLTPGDRVSVEYRRTSGEGPAGEPVIRKTVATRIVLLRSALPEGTLRSEDSAAGP